MSERKGELTGRHVLIIMVCAFGVIIAANMAMLFAATGSFPGLVVKNSYVAGVGWDKRAAEQRALGWKTEAAYSEGELLVRIVDAAGEPVEGLSVSAVVGRPASAAEDRSLTLGEVGSGYLAPIELADGLWRIAITGSGPDGEAYTVTAELHLRDGKAL